MRRLFKIILVLCIITFLCPLIFYWNKPVHVSIDDVMVLERLSDSCDYHDVFEDPFMNWIRDYHNSTGAKFTLYIYENNVNEIPMKYWAQIRDNAEWLKIGWHATSPEQPESRSTEEFVASYYRLDSILDYYAPENKTSTLRLHYWKALPSEIAFLKERGVDCLLAADRKTVSYSLSPEDISYLEDKELLQRDGMTYKKTDFRVEKVRLLPALVKNAADEELVVFTHEWAMIEGSKELFRFGVLLDFLHLYGSNFEY